MNIFLPLYPGDRVAWLMINVVIQATLICAVALLFVRLFAGHRPALRHGVLVCALAACLVSPVLTIAFDLAGVRLIDLAVAELRVDDGAAQPVARSEIVASAASEAGEGSSEGEFLEDPFSEFPTFEPTQVNSPTSPTANASPNRESERLATGDGWRAYGGALVAIWLAVALVLLGRLSHGCRSVRQWRREARAFGDRRIAAMLRSVVRELGLKRVPALACTGESTGPVTVGTMRPIILLPDALVASASDREMRHLLLHECAHIMRHDCLIGMFQRFVQILYWPQPLVHTLNRQIATAREEVCDNHVLLSSERTEYGRTLLELSELFATRRDVPTAIGFLSRSGNLEQRIHGILDPRRILMTRMRYSLSIGFTCTFLGLAVLIGGTRLTTVKAADDAGPQAEGQPAQPAAGEARLNSAQQVYHDWTEHRFKEQLGESRYANLAGPELEERQREWLEQLARRQGRERIEAINGLAATRSSKAVEPLAKVAAERVEKDNRDRWMAVRALGLLGDDSVVPELVHLTYHYNQNTRFWAQISLVRLTGQNFGRDVAAWRKWWNAQGRQPAITDEVIAWTSREEWADSERQQQADTAFVARIQSGELPTTGAPRILATSPEVGATGVDPAITEITVTFDRDMGEGFSWTGGGDEFPPSPTGKSAVWRDKRTCVLPVELETARFYRVGINSTSFQNFRSSAGVPVQPSAIYFATSGAGEKVNARTQRPRVVAMNPHNGATNVDPNLRELRVTFNVPMDGGFSWTGGGPRFPEIPAGKRPRWSDDRKTCVLPVRLKSSWDYRLGLNSPSHNNFQSTAGVPLEPLLYVFQTRED